MKFISLSLIFFLLPACSLLQKEDTNTSSNPTYSKETDKAFSEIERSSVHDLVENLHEKNIKNAVNTSPLPPTDHVPSIAVREIKLPGTPSTLRELNQVLNFHCMKHRKRFSKDDVCHQKINQSIDRCENKHQKVTADFVRCLKEELRRI